MRFFKIISEVQLQVQDLPIFKNQELDMGPHLHVILDNQPYIAVYDLDQPGVSRLTPWYPHLAGLRLAPGMRALK